MNTRLTSEDDLTARARQRKYYANFIIIAADSDCLYRVLLTWVFVNGMGSCYNYFLSKQLPCFGDVVPGLLDPSSFVSPSWLFSLPFALLLALEVSNSVKPTTLLLLSIIIICTLGIHGTYNYGTCTAEVLRQRTSARLATGSEFFFGPTSNPEIEEVGHHLNFR